MSNDADLPPILPDDTILSPRQSIKIEQNEASPRASIKSGGSVGKNEQENTSPKLSVAVVREDEQLEPPQEADEPPKQEDEPPKQEDGPPKQEDEPPKQEDEPPKQEDEPPKQEDEPPKQEDEPPKQEDEPPKQEDEPPKQEDEPPKQEDEPPKQEDEPPKQEDEPPKQADEPPKQADEPPKQEDEPPKQVDEPPKQVDEPQKQPESLLLAETERSKRVSFSGAKSPIKQGSMDRRGTGQFVGQGGLKSNKDFRQPTLEEEVVGVSRMSSGGRHNGPSGSGGIQPWMMAAGGILGLTLLMRMFMSNFKFICVVLYAALVSLLALRHYGKGPLAHRRSR